MFPSRSVNSYKDIQIDFDKLINISNKDIINIYRTLTRCPNSLCNREINVYSRCLEIIPNITLELSNIIYILTMIVKRMLGYFAEK